MASLTIPFPEGTRTLVLRGKRITIGRLPDNTIQMRDRTVSAYHAELVEEGGHFRLHDKNSTNGIVVNGQRVSDFHLHEDCKITFGGMVCDFSLAAAESPENEADIVPARSEMLAVLQANSDLRAEVAALKQQVEGMQKAREANDAGAQTVSLAEHDKLLAEITALRGTLQEKQTQIDRLTSLVAITTRERDSLQKGYDDARAALEKARKAPPTGSAQPAEAPAASTQPTAPSPSAAAVAPTKAPAPIGSVPAKAPVAPTAPSAPSGPRVTAAPSVPRIPVPSGARGPGAPGAGMPGAAAPGAKPLPKPPGNLGSGSPSRRPASGVQPSAMKAPSAAPATKSEPVLAEASVGPKGTQKLVE